MHKETSSRVSGIASRLIHISPATIIGASDKGHSHIENLCEDIRALAGSCMSQDETPGQAPETFVDRLRREFDELQTRLQKLHSFLLTEAATAEIAADQLELLNMQLDAMRLYHAILKLRLAALNTENVNAD